MLKTESEHLVPFLARGKEGRSGVTPCPVSFKRDCRIDAYSQKGK